jgi:hypothetical protein
MCIKVLPVRLSIFARAMHDRATPIREYWSRCVRSAFGTVIFSLLMMLSGGTVQTHAGQHSGFDVSATQQIASKSQVVMTWAPSVPKTNGGPCCTGAYQSGGTGCSNSTCSACSAAAQASASSVSLETRAPAHGSADEAGLILENPDVDFRPPRRMI